MSFSREAALALELNHPAIMQLYDVGVRDGYLFMELEPVAGHSLEDLLQSRRWSHAAAAKIAFDCADALAHAHGRRDPAGRPAPIVHGSLSPRAVFVSSKGETKIQGFGRATGEALTVAGDIRSLRSIIEQLFGAVPPRIAAALEEAIAREDVALVAAELKAIVEPADVSRHRAAAHFDRGFELMREGRHREALGEWLRAAEIDPENRAYECNIKRLRGRLEVKDGPG